NVTTFTNAGTLLATDNSTLVLSADTVSNSGTVEVDYVDPTHFSTLNFEGSTISGGTVTVDGLFDSTGTSSISNASITIAATGTLEATAGTLTIDPSSIDNSGLLEANGGELDIDNVTTFTNAGTLLATDNSTLVLSGDIVSNSGTVEVDYVDATHFSTLSFEGSSISGGTVTVDGLFDSTGTSSISNASITIAATGTLEATAGTLTIDPSSTDNSGLLEANGGEL